MQIELKQMNIEWTSQLKVLKQIIKPQSIHSATNKVYNPQKQLERSKIDQTLVEKYVNQIFVEKNENS